MKETWGGPSMRPEDFQIPEEQTAEQGEKRPLLEDIRNEGKMSLSRLYQGFETAVGRKYHPEPLRKALGEFSEPITPENYDRMMQEFAISRAVSPAMEVFYGTLSMASRKTVEGMLKAGAKFGRGLGDLAERAGVRFETPEKMYGLDKPEA